MTIRRLTPLLAGLSLVVASTVHAQTAPADLIAQPVIASGLSSPIAVRAPGDGSGRLFIIQKGGAIRIWKPTSGLNATPFLTVPVSTSSEQGLLGLAFHPQFATNGRFFVQYTRAPGGSNIGASADQLTAEYRVSAGNPDIADPASRIEILRIGDRAGNHNGGDLQFGPDGYLYVSMGDGGEQPDPHGFAQCLWRKPADSNPASCAPGSGANYALLGKILRIDINQQTSNPSSEMCGVDAGAAVANYAIPPGNPHIATSNTCNEIWHSGLRNPWRFSFDRQTQDMYIADVGYLTWEEVSFAAAGQGGINYGWRTCEGAFLRGSTTTACNFETLPILSYGRSVGQATTGGYRYRGAITALRGMYIYADSTSGNIFFAKPDIASSTGWSQVVWQDTAYSIVGFGEDEQGELYFVDYGGGGMYKFVSPSGAEAIFANGFE